MKTRLHIDRLVLKTSGLAPASAEATARALVPALANHLNQPSSPSGKIPALKVTVPASVASSPAQLASHVARQISSVPRS